MLKKPCQAYFTNLNIVKKKYSRPRPSQKPYSVHKFSIFCASLFLDVRGLHFRSTWKANVWIFLYISEKCIYQPRKFLFQRHRKLLFGRELIKRRRLAVWASQTVLKILMLIEIFGNSTIFKIIWTSRGRLWLNFWWEVTFSQNKIWQWNNTLTRWHSKSMPLAQWIFSSHSPASQLISFTLPHPPCYSLKVINYGMRKYICVYVGALVYHIISNEADDRIFRCNRIFGYPFMYKQLILIK